MSLEVGRIDSVAEVNRNQWNAVVEQSPLGCASHRYEWLRAIEAGLPHEPRHLVVSKKENPIAVLPNFVTEFGPLRRLSSIRPGFGGPIARTDEEEALELLLDSVARLCGGRVVYNEFRTYDLGFVRYHDLLSQRGYRPTILSCRFTLDLTQGWEALSAAMDSNRRRGIRRGHDADFSIEDEPVTDRTLSDFHDAYATVAERVGQPALPRSFFRELPRIDDRLKLFSLHANGERRGSYLFLLDDEQSSLQHLYTAVTEADFEYRAPELLHEHAIRWGIDEGYETYELRGSPPDFRDGVFRFKEAFGARTLPLLVYERGRPTPALPALNAGRALARRLRS